MTSGDALVYSDSYTVIYHVFEIYTYKLILPTDTSYKFVNLMSIKELEEISNVYCVILNDLIRSFPYTCTCELQHLCVAIAPEVRLRLLQNIESTNYKIPSKE